MGIDWRDGVPHLAGTCHAGRRHPSWGPFSGPGYRWSNTFGPDERYEDDATPGWFPVTAGVVPAVRCPPS